MLSLVAAVALQIPLAPMLPAGVSGPFQQACLAIERKLEAGEFEEAAKLERLLPTRAIRIQWDDRNVPEGLRKAFKVARDSAIAQWTSKVEGFQVAWTDERPQVRFTFEPVLATPAGADLPSGAVEFVSESESEPRIEAVIGLKRGKPLKLIADSDVANEVLYTLGSYLGLAGSPLFGGAMGRVDQSVGQPVRVSIGEGFIALSALSVADKLRAAIAERKRLAAAEPSLFLDPKSISLPPILQGKNAKFNIQVSNQGNAPLNFSLRADCGCFSIGEIVNIAPGSSAMIPIEVRSLDVPVGEHHRKLVLMSNDAERPVTEIPVNFAIQPLYTFYGPDQGLTLSEGVNKVVVYLGMSPEADFKPTEMKLMGVPAEVSFEPWSGIVPGRGQKIDGYKVLMQLSDQAPPGRSTVSLVALTNNKDHRYIRYNFNVQRGIVAMPESLYMGEVGNVPREFTVLLSRPGKSFKILNLESSDPHVKVTSKPVKGQWEHEITAAYNGKARSGILIGNLRVVTDDPKQKLIEIPFRANVP